MAGVRRIDWNSDDPQLSEVAMWRVPSARMKVVSSGKETLPSSTWSAVESSSRSNRGYSAAHEASPDPISEQQASSFGL
jgi:hypothetical protein